METSLPLALFVMLVLTSVSGIGAWITKPGRYDNVLTAKQHEVAKDSFLVLLISTLVLASVVVTYNGILPAPFKLLACSLLLGCASGAFWYILFYPTPDIGYE